MDSWFTLVNLLEISSMKLFVTFLWSKECSELRSRCEFSSWNWLESREEAREAKMGGAERRRQKGDDGREIREQWIECWRSQSSSAKIAGTNRGQLRRREIVWIDRSWPSPKSPSPFLHFQPLSMSGWDPTGQAGRPFPLPDAVTVSLSSSNAHFLLSLRNFEAHILTFPPFPLSSLPDPWAKGRSRDYPSHVWIQDASWGSTSSRSSSRSCSRSW